jgi:hypothetical protein
MPRSETDMGSAQAKVAILGGDPVTSRFLEALLRATGYRAWSLPEDRVDEIDQVLADSRLLIVAPSPSAKFRNVLLDRLSGQPTVEIPILELLSLEGERIFQGERAALWPCSPEALKRAVDSALHFEG